MNNRSQIICACVNFSKIKNLSTNCSLQGDLNSRPLVYKTSALTPELWRLRLLCWGKQPSRNLVYKKKHLQYIRESSDYMGIPNFCYNLWCTNETRLYLCKLEIKNFGLGPKARTLVHCPFKMTCSQNESFSI